MSERLHCPTCGWPLRARGLREWYCLQCEEVWDEVELRQMQRRLPASGGQSDDEAGAGGQLGLFEGAGSV